MCKKYIVELSGGEIQELTAILNRGKHPAQKRKRAHALLLASEGSKSDKEIAKIVLMNEQSVTELRKRFSQNGFGMALNSLPHRRRPKAIDGENEARLLALATRERQEGRQQCSLRTLARKFVTSDGRRVSHETIRQALKKMGAGAAPSSEWVESETNVI
ncbi:MAG: helix-turn-helix domain-containing protein [Deltaproteobacteria bacterium]|jgi:transposase|nr:helix-turn-helix domain-containing protein [Deltaproteobacteria bacterium]